MIKPLPSSPVDSVRDSEVYNSSPQVAIQRIEGVAWRSTFLENTGGTSAMPGSMAAWPRRSGTVFQIVLPSGI